MLDKNRQGFDLLLLATPTSGTISTMDAILQQTTCNCGAGPWPPLPIHPYWNNWLIPPIRVLYHLTVATSGQASTRWSLDTVLRRGRLFVRQKNRMAYNRSILRFLSYSVKYRCYKVPHVVKMRTNAFGV